MKILIFMTGENQRSEAAFPRVYAQFLFKLANQCDFGRFALLNFAPRKLPQTGHGFAFWPLSKKDPAVHIDQGNG